jgi:hypothetical protein
MLSKLELSTEASSPFEVIKETFFAIGVSRRAGCDFSTFSPGAEVSEEATAGVVRSMVAFEDSGKAVAQQTNAIAAKTMKHPSGRRTKMLTPLQPRLLYCTLGQGSLAHWSHFFLVPLLPADPSPVLGL